MLAGFAALGCRNAIGLDHFVVSASLQPRVKAAEKLTLGKVGGSKGPIEGKPNPLLAVSDHCPIVMTSTCKCLTMKLVSKSPMVLPGTDYWNPEEMVYDKFKADKRRKVYPVLNLAPGTSELPK